MITCIAVDDEPMALELIQRYCGKCDWLDLRAVFREPVKAIQYLGREKIDLIFLDINMPDVDGMQLIQTLSPIPLVIFTTAYSQYAAESYNRNAIDYLVKPITFERFLTAVNKVVAALRVTQDLPAGKESAEVGERMTGKDEEAGIFLKSGAQTHQVKLRDILYLEKQGNYITVYLKDRSILIRESMGDVFDRVPAADFIRVHKSYVVAIRHIAMIEVHQLTVNNKKIPVGGTYRESLKARLGID